MQYRYFFVSRATNIVNFSVDGKALSVAPDNGVFYYSDNQFARVTFSNGRGGDYNLTVNADLSPEFRSMPDGSIDLVQVIPTHPEARTAAPAYPPPPPAQAFPTPAAYPPPPGDV